VIFILRGAQPSITFPLILDTQFNLDGLTQPNPPYPHAAPQAADEKGWPSLDGDYWLARHIGCVPRRGSCALPFFLHGWNPELPLLWSGGTVIRHPGPC
jgi:hypothetical protein